MSYLAAYSLSVSDLVLDKEFVKAYGEGTNNSKILKILYKYGLDVNKPLEEVFCEHRNLQNKVVKCIRYEGYERTDKQYIESGLASVYAKIEASKHDPHMKGELLSMLHQGSTANAWLEEDLYNGEKEKQD
jgi:hypothetical protein